MNGADDPFHAPGRQTREPPERRALLRAKDAKPGVTPGRCNHDLPGTINLNDFFGEPFEQEERYRVSYYIRVFGTSLADIPLQKLQECAAPAVIQVEEGSGESWQQLVLKHDGGPEIAAIEKNPVDDGEIGADELNEFLEEVPLYWPDSAAAWLQSYLPNVKVIYAFQLLSGTDVKDGWTPLHRIYDCIWKIAGGILQADREGFSNEQGYTILWQFGKTAKGPWKVGLPVNGSGVHFQIDLGNAQHREAFMDGRIPDGVKLL